MENSGDIQLLLSQVGQLSVLERDDLRRQLLSYVNYLLLHDFSMLVQLLYRVDVDENKLTRLLREHPADDAAGLITDMMLARQEEKFRHPASGKENTDVIPDEEKW